MKTILFLLVSTFLYGQSNLYWQVRSIGFGFGPFWENEYTFYNYSEEVSYFFTAGMEILEITDHCGAATKITTKKSVSADYARIDDSLFVSLQDEKIYKIVLPSHTVHEISDFHAIRLLQVNENLVYAMDPEFKVFKSTNNLRTWEYVNNLETIVTWVSDGDEAIYYTTPENELKKANLQFNYEVLFGTADNIKFGLKMISPGKDTLFFLGKQDFWKTMDGGITFEKSARNVDLVNTTIYYDNGNIYILDYRAINKSTNLGTSWEFPYRDAALVGYAKPFLYVYNDAMSLMYSHERYYDVLYDPNFEVPEYEDFFPLHVGNRWRFDKPVIGNSSVIEVTGEQIIEGKTWYTIANKSNPVRYENHVLYSYDGTTSKVEIDFRFNPGNIINTGYLIEAEIMWEGKKTFFGKDYYLRGPLNHRVNVDELEFYSPGFGPMFFNYSEPGYAGGYLDSPRKIVEATVFQDGEFKHYPEGGTDVEESHHSISSYELGNNYPNPFNPSTTINYNLAKNSFVTLDVYNFLGEKITTLINEQQNEGYYEVHFDGSSLASGVYIARLHAESGKINFTKSIKMILIK